VAATSAEDMAFDAAGRLFVTEILLLAMLPWLWRARDRPRLPRWFVGLWAGWLLSQIVTDVVVGRLDGVDPVGVERHALAVGDRHPGGNHLPGDE